MPKESKNCMNCNTLCTHHGDKSLHVIFYLAKVPQSIQIEFLLCWQLGILFHRGKLRWHLGFLERRYLGILDRQQLAIDRRHLGSHLGIRDRRYLGIRDRRHLGIILIVVGEGKRRGRQCRKTIDVIGGRKSRSGSWDTGH